MKARILRDRYFIIPFAYENDGNDPEFSHSFISVIRVFADDKQPRLHLWLHGHATRFLTAEQIAELREVFPS